MSYFNKFIITKIKIFNTNNKNNNKFIVLIIIIFIMSVSIKNYPIFINHLNKLY